MKYLDVDAEKIRYADGIFRSIYYHYSVILRTGDRLDEIGEALKGTVRSPSIRNPDEAKYQRGTIVYHCNIAELITEEQETAARYRASEAVLYNIAEFLEKQCTPQEIEIMCAYYDLRKSLYEIGMDMHYSKDSIRLRRNAVLTRYAELSAANDF